MGISSPWMGEYDASVAIKLGQVTLDSLFMVQEFRNTGKCTRPFRIYVYAPWFIKKSKTRRMMCSSRDMNKI